MRFNFFKTKIKVETLTELKSNKNSLIVHLEANYIQVRIEYLFT